MYLYNDTIQRLNRKKLRKDQTEAERVLWSKVRNGQINGLKFFRQYSVGPYTLDLYCPKVRLAIELDGGQHDKPSEQSRDEKRTEFLNQNNIKVLRFWNNEVLNNIEGVYEKILEEINKL